MIDKFTKFTVEQSDKKIVFEVPYEDIDGELCMDAIRCLMIGLTFSPETVLTSMRNYINSND